MECRILVRILDVYPRKEYNIFHIALSKEIFVDVGLLA